MLHDSKVPPSAAPLTVEDVRELLAPKLLALCSAMGPTRLGIAVGGADDKTIRAARDETSTLSPHYMVNLLLLDGTALDPFLARIGRRSVPAHASCSTDPLPAMTGAVHKLASAGHALKGSQLLDAEPQLQAAFDAIGYLLRQIDAVRAAA